ILHKIMLFMKLRPFLGQAAGRDPAGPDSRKNRLNLFRNMCLHRIGFGRGKGGATRGAPTPDRARNPGHDPDRPPIAPAGPGCYLRGALASQDFTDTGDRPMTHRTLLGLSLALALATAPSLARAADELKVGDPAPEFSLKGSDGKTCTLSDFKG